MTGVELSAEESRRVLRHLPRQTPGHLLADFLADVAEIVAARVAAVEDELTSQQPFRVAEANRLRAAAAEAEVARLTAERDHALAAAKSMDHFATVAQRCEAKSNEYAAENRRLSALVEAGLAAVGHECLDFSRGCASVYPDQADRWCHVCSVRAALGGTA